MDVRQYRIAHQAMPTSIVRERRGWEGPPLEVPSRRGARQPPRVTRHRCHSVYDLSKSARPTGFKSHSLTYRVDERAPARRACRHCHRGVTFDNLEDRALSGSTTKRTIGRSLASFQQLLE